MSESDRRKPETVPQGKDPSSKASVPKRKRAVPASRAVPQLSPGVPSALLSLMKQVYPSLNAQMQYPQRAGAISLLGMSPPPFISSLKDHVRAPILHNGPPVDFNIPPLNLAHIAVMFTRNVQFKDDEEIDIKVVESRRGDIVTEDKLELSAKCALDPIQVSPTSQEVPCMVSLRGVCKDLEEIERMRPGLDLVCVIDVSGSMKEGKLGLVQETLNFLVTKLTHSDRLSLVVFRNDAFRVCPLIAATSEGKRILEGYIGMQKAGGGTNIAKGLECGLRILAHRRVVNTVTSLFLLSDGEDDNVSTALARVGKVITRCRSQIRGDFTVHTFGYGADHDSNVMCNIADQGNGGFHFVEKLEAVAEAFADSFGGLVSQVAKNVEVRLQVAPAPVPCRITKVYTKSGEDFFSLPAVMASESKDFVFILEVGPGELREAQACPVVVAEVRYSSVAGLAVTERAELAINFVPAGKQVELNARENVLVNFYRVKGAEVLKEASFLAEQGKFDLSRQCLEAGINELRDSLVVGNVLVAQLTRDLMDAKLRVRDDNSWRMGGAAQVNSAFRNHYLQQASANVQCYMQPQQMAYNMQFQAFQGRKQP